ncbi:zf-HC2 domain-containing protein [Schinkia sp. CFF1]
MNQCKLVQDLLPLYLTRELSKEINVFVESHLINCKTCRSVKQELLNCKQLELKAHSVLYTKSKPSKQELDFINRLTKWKRISAIIAVCLLLFFSLMAWIFIKGKIEPHSVNQQILLEKVTVFNMNESSSSWG